MCEFLFILICFVFGVVFDRECGVGLFVLFVLLGIMFSNINMEYVMVVVDIIELNVIWYGIIVFWLIVMIYVLECF